jgi:glycosyltransferase involved in cell wall biosynthesis
MRIAQVAPLFESVPPRYYGGTERIVSYLTEELVRMGHEVTLFASGDSVTRAELVPVCERSLRLDRSCKDTVAQHVLQLEQVLRRAREFDVIHFHVDYLHYPWSRRRAFRHVTTLHGRLDLPELVALYREFRHVPVVSISDAQRLPLPVANWRGTVYHGLPEDLHAFGERPEEYLAFLGRVSPEKGLDRAIEMARRSGIELRIAAKIDEADRAYFESVIRPLLRGRGVEFLGEIGERDKDTFLRNARALLFPIDWPEPFGLVMIEAMACGTPVIAFRNGSVPEVMVEGESGFVCADVNEGVRAIERVAGLSRRACRAVFERRFTARRMAEDYLDVYRGLVSGRKPWKR